MNQYSFVHTHYAKQEQTGLSPHIHPQTYSHPRDFYKVLSFTYISILKLSSSKTAFWKMTERNQLVDSDLNNKRSFYAYFETTGKENKIDCIIKKWLCKAILWARCLHSLGFAALLWYTTRRCCRYSWFCTHM